MKKILRNIFLRDNFSESESKNIQFYEKKRKGFLILEIIVLTFLVSIILTDIENISVILITLLILIAVENGKRELSTKIDIIKYRIVSKFQKVIEYNIT